MAIWVLLWIAIACNFRNSSVQYVEAFASPGRRRINYSPSSFLWNQQNNGRKISSRIPFTLTTTIKWNERHELVSLNGQRRDYLNQKGRRLLRCWKRLSLRKKVKPVEDGTLPNKNNIKTEVKTCQELDDYFTDEKREFRKKDNSIDYNRLLASLSVKGDTQIIGSPNHKDVVHPAIQLLHERRRTKSPLTPVGEKRPDGYKVALVIEGGGMRGCVTGGMVSAIYYLGLEDTFDVIYGSSAGTVIGSYLNTRQLPWFGPEIYYDRLTTAGKNFIDTKRLLRAVGLGLLNPTLAKDVIFRHNHGKPVLNLDFLLKTTIQQTKPLDWDKFVEMQKVQPVKVVASGLLRSNSSVIMSMEQNSFQTLDELSKCMHAACLLPGVAGAIMNINLESLQSNTSKDRSKEYLVKNNVDTRKGMEAFADTLIYEPLPYRSAVAENATHVLMLRSRPDGSDVTGKSSIFERLIVRRFFSKKNPQLREVFKYMKRHFHKKLYAEQIIELNDASKDLDRPYTDISSPHIAAIAVPEGSPEIARMEVRRDEIFSGVRRGFARAYDALVEDPSERGNGHIIAQQFFPDEILDYNPLDIESSSESAFQTYLNELMKNRTIDDKKTELWGKTANECGLPV